MTKRKLFSKKDGTNLKQDIAAIKENIKARFEHLPIELKKLLPIAEDIVIYLQLLDDMLEEGHPVNEAIEKVLALTKSEVDDKLYKWIKSAIENLLTINIGGSYSKLAAASTALMLYVADTTNAFVSDIEADTAIQLAVYSIKS